MKISAKSQSKKFAVWFALLIVTPVVALFIWYGASSPQLAGDEEVLRTTDALFTAVTARDESLLFQVERKLSSLYENGKIPKSAWKKLATYIRLAKSKEWTSSAKQLYDFIERQRIVQ